jgi:enoyl-CoA hydratase/carnithine racemase
MEVEIEHRGPVVHVRFGDGGDNLFRFDDCTTLMDLLGDPPADTRILRLRARGDTFCLGREAFPALEPDAVRASTRTLVRLHEAMAESRLVIVTEVQGAAAGFGVGLIAMADVSIGSPAATFRFPEAEEGFAPSIVLTWLPRVVGERRAFDLTATARTFDAGEAHRIGILTSVASSAERLAADVDAYVDGLLEIAPHVHHDIKRFLDATRDLTRSQALELGADRLAFGALRAASRGS